MSSTTVSLRTAKRIFTFNAGPAALPLPVLERIREELLDWRGSGMSVMEMRIRKHQRRRRREARETPGHPRQL